MEDGFFKIGILKQFVEVEVVAVLANTVEGLEEGSKALLTVEDEESVFVAVESWVAPGSQTKSRWKSGRAMVRELISVRRSFRALGFVSSKRLI